MLGLHSLLFIKEGNKLLEISMLGKNTRKEIILDSNAKSLEIIPSDYDYLYDFLPDDGLH
uniref:Uncharacterized protein n=1 Tax=Moumouvirus sp. 'Monve' TaxID=1128131 RepID=H2EFQ5_9VIRU|nr:hypothetical protein mv_R1118 [Moumouvirus Monve]